MNRSSTALGLLGLALLAACSSTGSMSSRIEAPQAAAPAAGGDSDAELAKKLSNPIAALISVPLQYNYDKDIGPNDGTQSKLNVQPVIPFTLNEEWNVISRTILPLVDLEDIPTQGDSTNGFGDITQSLFFSPKAPTASGWIWGAGPVFILPTASDDLLGSGKWCAGPTIVALKQDSGWTYGMLANHAWSFAGDSDRGEVNNTFLQPFLSYQTPTKTTLGVNTESSYDWTDSQWTVPLNFTVSQLLRVGKMPVRIQLGARYWAEAPDSGPEGWGVRFAITLLFPR